MTMIQFLGEWLVRSSILILAGALLVWLLRAKDPEFRLTAWTALLAGSMAIPLLAAALPKVPLPLLRAPARVSATASLPAPAEPPAILRSPRILGSLAAPAPPRPANARLFDRMRFAAVLYALPASALLLRLFAGFVISLHIFRRSRPTGIVAGRFEVRESELVASPVTIGVLRSAVLLPLDWRTWNSAKLEAVLAHERSHIRRRDPAAQFVSAIHRALLWASPASWFLHRGIVRTAEQISDDDAVAATHDRVSYAEILLEFVQRGVGQTSWQGVPMARYDRPEKRIRRILHSTAVPHRVTRWGIAAVLVLGAPLTYLAAAAHPQSATPRPAPLPAQAAAAPSPAPSTVPAPIEAPSPAPSTVPAPIEAPSPAPSTVPAPIEAPSPAPSTVPASIEAPAPAPAPSPAPAHSPAPQSPIAPSPSPEPLPAFEVASVKPADLNSGRSCCITIRPGARIEIHALPLKSLIATAFRLSWFQISGGDAWIEKDGYDIEAKPSDDSLSSIKTLRYTWYGIEDEHLRQMLQALLIDRFQLKFHRETKTGDVYLLKQSGKPLALHATDAPLGGADPAGYGNIGYVAAKWSIYAYSMPQLAKFAADYILHAPVLDRTELSGPFDYKQRQPDLEPNSGPDQTDTFLHFLSELGLKLERAKGPVESFVIDDAAKPSPN
jgi:uncharacterized protein (TIGR03435 family)